MIKKGSFAFQGDKLKLARELKTWTISKLGSELEVSHQLISDWENDKKKPTFEKILEIENILGFPRQFYYTQANSLKEDNDLAFFLEKELPLLLNIKSKLSNLLSFLVLLFQSSKNMLIYLSLNSLSML